MTLRKSKYDISIFSFVILNEVKRDILYSLSTLQRDKQSALRKKELKAFFGEYFNENAIICIDFQFHEPKSQESIHQAGLF